jgi:tetratricopeptide (TPR) repeat protein
MKPGGDIGLPPAAMPARRFTRDLITSLSRGTFKPERSALRRIWVIVLLALTFTGLGCQKLKARITMKQANELYRAERYEEAIKKYEEVAKIDPWWADAYRNAGLCYLALYQPGSLHQKDIQYSTNAIVKLRRYLQFTPQDEKAEDLLMDTYMKTGRYEEAVAFYQNKLKKEPGNSKYLQLIGMIYAKANNFEEARKFFNERAQADAKNPEAWYSLGVLCWERAFKNQELTVDEKRSLIDEGMSSLKKAVELRPDYFEAYSYINLLYRQKALTETEPEQSMKDLQEADANMKKAIQLRNEQMKKGT